MKDFLILVAIVLLSAFLGAGISAIYSNTRIVPTLGNSIENMENLKRDCEKSLPRDKECVLVFDYVSAENDYENN